MDNGRRSTAILYSVLHDFAGTAVPSKHAY